jgi:outer membrane protein OmpA-like peptidoglycan-associated protein
MTQGFGATRPKVPNTKPDGSDDPEGRQINRRVEIVFGTR